MAKSTGSALTTKPLDRTTWADFARLVEKHNGVWGGCWCIAYHAHTRHATVAQRQSEKHEMVLHGRAHAALVYDGEDAIGWRQFGPTAELPGIRNRRNYEASRLPLPDWRITCFFVDKSRRHEGVAHAALRGALYEIARGGGGSVEGYPEEVEGRSTSGSFLHGGTTAMFEREGFRRGRPIGMHQWVMTKVVGKISANAPAKVKKSRAK